MVAGRNGDRHLLSPQICSQGLGKILPKMFGARHSQQAQGEGAAAPRYLATACARECT